MNVVKKKHQQLYDILLHALSIGIYPDGAKLPKMTELAEKYSVSVNIVTKAIAMLKEKNLVTIKAGDGIFSSVDNLKKEKQPQRFSGEKVFSAYGKSKKLSVLIEDSETWQLEFWNTYFENFTQKNPDIEIKASYGHTRTANSKKHDLVIGGNHFINLEGYGIDNFISSEELEIFAKDLYLDKILTPRDIAWKNKAALYPIAFQLPLILHRKMDYAMPEKQNVLDFIDSLKNKGKLKQIRYKTWSLQNFMVNCGCNCFDPATGEFKIDDRKKWQATIDQIRDIYSTEDMLALHGKPLDYKHLFSNELGKGIYYAECPYNTLNTLDMKGIDCSPYPMGDTFPLITIVCGILKDTPFPEEALRIIAGLLETEIQKKYMLLKLGFPVSNKALESSKFSYLLKQLPAMKKVLVAPCDRVLDDAVETVLTWELYYYFTGKITGDVLSRIEKKVGYFIKNYNTQKQEGSDESA